MRPQSRYAIAGAKAFDQQEMVPADAMRVCRVEDSPRLHLRKGLTQINTSSVHKNVDLSFLLP